METAQALRTKLKALALAAAIFVGPSLSCSILPSPGLAEGIVQISPVLLDLAGANAVGVINFSNQAHEPTSIQVRVFRWRQADGQESLEPTDDIVASPPRADLGPGETLSIRVVRATQTPIAGEDAYRLVIDQLPAARDSGKAVVSILLRQVLPVFFADGARSGPKVTWSVARRGGQSLLVATNEGDRRLRIGKLTLTGHGAAVTIGGSLLGYVLAHSQMSWTLPAKSGGFAIGSEVAIRGQGDLGAISASAPVVGAP